MKKLLLSLIFAGLTTHSGLLAAEPASSSADKPPVTTSPDTQPKPRTQTRPIYPKELLSNPIGGEAVVDFIVDTNGNVQNAFAIKQTHELFGQAAVAAVKKWTFRPGLKNGVPVAVHMQVPLVFKPNDAKKK